MTTDLATILTGLGETESRSMWVATFTVPIDHPLAKQLSDKQPGWSGKIDSGTGGTVEGELLRVRLGDDEESVAFEIGMEQDVAVGMLREDGGW